MTSKVQPMYVRFPPDLHAAVVARAAAEDRSMASLIRLAVALYLTRSDLDLEVGGHQDVRYLRGALGELIDALNDEVRHEVSQSAHVIDKIDDACRLLGPEYQGYIGGWLG